MLMLRELIDKRIQCLNDCIPNIEDDGCSELSLCDYSQELMILYLLRDERFIEILDKHSSEIEDGELADFLCECLKNGFPIFASKWVAIYLFSDEVCDTREHISLPACIQEIAKMIDNPVHNEEPLVDDTEEYGTEPKSNIESYYFDVNYVTSEQVGKAAEQSILFDSNLIDRKQFVLDILSQINHCQFEDFQGTIKVTLTDLNSFSKLNIYSFDRGNLSVCYKRNVLAIIGDAVSVEDCYLILKSTLGAVYDLIDSANILQKIESKVVAFDDKFRQISIKRLPLSSLVVSRCDNSKLLKIEDISNVNIKELGKDTLIELLSAIEDIDFSMPAELVAKMMRK